MKRFIKIDYEMGFSSVCNTEDEVIESCGYEVGEITFKELLAKIDNSLMEIIEIESDVKWLTDNVD